MSSFDRQITNKKELIDYFVSRFGMTEKEAIESIEEKNLYLDDNGLENARKERKEFFNR
jgi:hypothetical protein